MLFPSTSSTSSIPPTSSTLSTNPPIFNGRIESAASSLTRDMFGQEFSIASSHVTIDLTSMADANNEDGQDVVVNTIQDAIVTDAEAIGVGIASHLA